MERAMGIGPTYQPWEGCALPLSYARITSLMIFRQLAGVNDDVGSGYPHAP